MKKLCNGAGRFLYRFVPLLLLGYSHTFAASPPSLNDPVEGERLARHLRELAPGEAADFKGALRISRPGAEPQEIPLTSQLVIGENNWTAVYTAKIGSADETLSISHRTNSLNQYSWQRGNQILKFGENEATNHFAGSDFALVDLGLGFLHWPKQVLVTREMRKGRGCDVLESRPERPSLYRRVVSWIDQETSGLLMAEAYDAKGRLLKEFEVKGFKKVAGQWQVHEMEIRNRQTKTATRLQFDFDKQ